LYAFDIISYMSSPNTAIHIEHLSENLRLSALSVTYPHHGRVKQAVQNLSLELEAGEIGVLLGPSGCGKTSVLRAIAGFVGAAQGSVQVGSRMLSGPGVHASAQSRKIGLVFQDYALFPHLSVRGNIAFGIQHLSRAERDARVDELIGLVALKDEADRYPHHLSGGQQQRVALARALAPRPSLMLLDEPFSSLDAELRERLALEIRSILKATGTTTLVVTHDQLEAFALGDKVGVMREGVLEQWDSPYSLYHRPQTRFVADFIGHAAFIQGQAKLCEDAKSVCIRVPFGELRFDPKAQATEEVMGESQTTGLWLGAELKQSATQPCRVLLRADDVVHDDASPTQAQILRKAFRGSEFLYTLELASGDEVLSLVPSHHNHSIGERIGIRLMLDHVIAFGDS
jgi:iron(III) transport system ATP-binding protein